MMRGSEIIGILRWSNGKDWSKVWRIILTSSPDTLLPEQNNTEHTPRVMSEQAYYIGFDV